MSVLYSNPNTPGVKIVEKSVLPPSIVQVSSGIPVFLGYTSDGPSSEAVRISSFKEYQDTFGGPFKYRYDVSAAGVATVAKSGSTEYASVGTYFFYEAIQLYFLNGGGPCYIISVGTCDDTAKGTNITSYISASDFTSGIQLLDKLDEPTIIAFPEAANLEDNAQYGLVVTAALNVCGETKDKFVLVDVPNTGTLTNVTNRDNFRGTVLTSSYLNYGAVYFPNVVTSLNYVYDEGNSTYDSNDLDTLTASADYGKAYRALYDSHTVEVPPSALVAGVYAKTDRERGVWKAPANVALQGVVKPAEAVSDGIQNELNVDASTGKSINVIREFTGKGTIVWGARTMDGNSNEWRYVPVRRLFITVEESVKKATSQFVFENNDAKTWVKVSSMIEAYLNGLWKDGGLMGSTPEEAYFVSVGLGTTMTQQDILEGKMIVKVGLAAVRPAEFIVLEFSHYLNS